jgi:hypothetical protein
MAKQRFESFEPLGPQPLVGAEPIIGLGKGLRVDLTEVGPAAHGPPHKPSVLERLDVLGRGGQRHFERLGQLPHRAFLCGQPAEHGAPGGIAQGAEDTVEVSVSFNHTVKYTAGSADSQPYG